MWLIIRQRIKSIKKSANSRVLRERKMHELEQMALRAQMNPHFIFNSLNSLQQYVFGGNVLEANQFITAFSSLIRQTLDISEKKFITLTEEIKYLDTYLNIEQTKYDNAFDYFIDADNIVQREQIIIPPLLLQPYIENSIRHGILNLQGERGSVFVSFRIENHALICMLEDNGIGRKNANRLKKGLHLSHSSMGMQLVKKRIESLKNLYKIDIHVLIEDIKKNNQTGTRVIIKLPLSYDE
jgi:LytS/YehU family sensor histidine kinase